VAGATLSNSSIRVPGGVPYTAGRIAWCILRGRVPTDDAIPIGSEITYCLGDLIAGAPPLLKKAEVDARLKHFADNTRKNVPAE